MQLKIPAVSFADDSRGVSGVVGFIFIFAIIMILLSINQSQVVPQENAEVEFQHFQDVRNDMARVHAAISEAGQADVDQYPTVTLGTTYPPRLFAVNPPPPSGTLESSQAYNISIINQTGAEPENVSTRFLEYQNGYNEMDIGSIWYENSVLYLDERANGGGIAIYENQGIIRNDSRVRITALQEEFRKSGTGEVTLNIYPADSADDILSQMSGDVSIEIPTRLSEDYWEDEFDSIKSSDDWEYVDTTYAETTSDGEIHRLELTVNVSKLKFNTVGIDSTPEAKGSASQGVGPGDGDGTNGGGGASDPPGNVAYNDANNNGYFDPGEATYTKSNLEDGFDNETVNLVIPSDVGTLDPNGNEIKANSITLRSDISSTGDEVKLEAEGTIDITGQSITTTGDDIEITAGESGSGELIATNATIDTNQDIALGSSGDMYIDKATVSAGNGKEASASLNDEDATLFVGGATITDQDDTLVYEPEEANIIGTPSSGSVKSD